MIPNFRLVHNKFKLNNFHYSHEMLNDVAYSFIKEGRDYEKKLGHFLLDWLDSKDIINVKTSGSTGQPKIISLKKQAMVYSAIATGNYFKLKPGDSSLLCLSTTYIAGKMMVIRAIILGLSLDLVNPNSEPFKFINKNYDFVAMVPLQLYSLKKYNKIRTIIVGGAKVSELLLEAIQDSESAIYATYGMTETATHIAVKKLNSNKYCDANNKFNVLPNIKISKDERDCLVIDAPYLSSNPIITNDIIKLHIDGSFELLGRFDNVINSGGIKIYPEQIEKTLTSYIETDYFIAALNNELLGEELVLFIEGHERELPSDTFDNLQKFEAPKRIVFIESFIRTPTGKINRMLSVKLIK